MSTHLDVPQTPRAAGTRLKFIHLPIICILGRSAIILVSQMQTTRSLMASDASIVSEPIYMREEPTAVKYFDCSKIDTLPIVRELGKGKQKTVYEVILPSGQHVAAKRCSHLQCETKNLILHEEFFYRTLFETFGNEKTMTYYGFCSFNPGKPKNFDPKTLTKGSTLFLELGAPVMDKWEDLELKADEIRPTSKADLDSLRDIARQYEFFPGGPLRMHGDNIYPHQYMRSKDGVLRHIDFDMVEQMPPPRNTTLTENCAIVLGGFAGLDKADPRLNCSVGYTEQKNETQNAHCSLTHSCINQTDIDPSL